MAQVFHPSTNTLARVSLLGLAIAPLALIMGLSAFSRSPSITKVEVPRDQPVPFSHAHHSNELGIDCRYCHQPVEKSPYGGVPATETCMSCHSQVWTNSPLLAPVRDSWRDGTPIKWNRLNKVPEFVYFNHSIHVDRGLSCNICHGPVQTMQLAYKAKPFTMAWCLECHRNPENAVGDPEKVWELYRKIQRLDVLTPEEQALAEGHEYHRKGEELEEGKRWVAKHKVKTEQLTDCWICHR